jgi:hypothetical protein
MNYNNIKKQKNKKIVHELHIIQEEMRFKNQEIHSIHFISNQNVWKWEAWTA